MVSWLAANWEGAAALLVASVSLWLGLDNRRIQQLDRRTKLRFKVAKYFSIGHAGPGVEHVVGLHLDIYNQSQFEVNVNNVRIVLCNGRDFTVVANPLRSSLMEQQFSNVLPLKIAPRSSATFYLPPNLDSRLLSVISKLAITLGDGSQVKTQRISRKTILKEFREKEHQRCLDSYGTMHISQKELDLLLIEELYNDKTLPRSKAS